MPVDDMNAIVSQFVTYVTKYAPWASKEAVQSDIIRKFALKRDRSVYFCDSFAVRFCQTKDKSFNNTILSLSTLQKYDKCPFMVVRVQKDGSNLLYLANTSFLRKISHSSRKLSHNNIAGSFNASDIIKDYNGIENCAENIEKLFAFHVDIDPSDNLKRLIEQTNQIEARGQKFIPNEEQLVNIYGSVKRAEKFVNSDDFTKLADDLRIRVEQSMASILIASRIENVNLRGRLIEALICSDHSEREILLKEIEDIEKTLPHYASANNIGDYVRKFENSDTYTDVKTKIMYMDSNPKAYNIDKFLQCMSEEKSVFLFFFVGIDERGTVKTQLCSVYHRSLQEATVVQYHWCGRNSRGVTQLLGKEISRIISDGDFHNNIDEDASAAFIKKLLCTTEGNQ